MKAPGAAVDHIITKNVAQNTTKYQLSNFVNTAISLSAILSMVLDQNYGCLQFTSRGEPGDETSCYSHYLALASSFSHVQYCQGTCKFKLPVAPDNLSV